MESRTYDFLDALRGIAIVLVLLAHLGFAGIPINPHISGIGGLGVSLFFMLSAYTLALSQYKRKEKDMGSFMKRRFFRIYPLYFGVISFVFLIQGIINYTGLPAITTPGISLNILNIISHYTFTFGFTPATLNGAVLGERSLFSELCFYSVFLLVFDYIKDSFTKVMKLLCLCFVVNILRWLCFYGLGNMNLQVFFNRFPLNNLIDFAMGFVLFHIHRLYEDNKVSIMPYGVILLGIVISIAGSIYGGRAITALTGIGTHFIWLLPFSLLSVGMLYSQGIFYYLGRSRILIWLGKTSYSIYLINIFILFGVGRLHLDWYISLGLSLFLIVGISSCTYQRELYRIQYGRGVSLKKE